MGKPVREEAVGRMEKLEAIEDHLRGARRLLQELGLKRLVEPLDRLMYLVPEDEDELKEELGE